jgi:hypothetical protein
MCHFSDEGSVSLGKNTRQIESGATTMHNQTTIPTPQSTAPPFPAALPIPNATINAALAMRAMAGRWSDEWDYLEEMARRGWLRDRHFGGRQWGNA